MINTILGGRYEILEEIGKGGMAYVYKARCILLNRIVAVKVLRDDLDGGDEFLKRFNTEAQAAASLTHSNIVSIFDVGADNDKHYIVMEYVDGITLKEYIVQKGRLDYREALDIAYQIADALQAAHEKNIVHRDIKPHNILVTEDRNIKVTDFGIARSGTGNTLSTDDDILGSVHYISPEQAKGETVDNRSDLYSLGIALYEMISGKVPFDADSPVAVAMMQIEGKAAPIQIDNVQLPPALNQIIFKAISKEPDMRYQNALEFKNDILKLIENPSYVLPDGDIYFLVSDDTLSEKGLFHDVPVQHVSKKTKYTMIFLAALTSLSIVVGGCFVAKVNVFSVIKDIFSSDSVTVPSLIGKTLEHAQTECQNVGFHLIIENEVSDDNAEPGTVVSQHPLQNEKAEKGETIKVTINKSGDSLLDDYTGESYKTAQKQLEDAGFTVDIIFEESKKSEDTVLRQSPAAGSKPKKNSTVTLYVSAGIFEDDNYKTVPTLTGKTYSKCVSLLSSSGLSLGTVSGVSEPHSDDIVISQAIPAGSLVKKGAAVGITLESSHREETPSDSTHEYSSDDSNNNISNENEETDNAQSGDESDEN